MKSGCHFSKTAIFCLLLALSCSGLWAQQQYQSIVVENINPLWMPLKPPGEVNSRDLLNSTMIPPLEYRTILAQYEQHYNPLLDGPENSNSQSSGLSDLLNNQMSSLLSLETQWLALEEQSKTLSSANNELTRLLEESKQTIVQLRWNLECALERVQDAEAGAITLLDENAEIFQQAKNAIANIEILQRQLTKSKRSAIIGFAIGGISFGAGTPLIIEGIRTDNSTMTWGGAGTIVGTGAIWALGHYVFQWW